MAFRAKCWWGKPTLGILLDATQLWVPKNPKGPVIEIHCRGATLVVGFLFGWMEIGIFQKRGESR